MWWGHVLSPCARTCSSWTTPEQFFPDMRDWTKLTPKKQATGLRCGCLSADNGELRPVALPSLPYQTFVERLLFDAHSDILACYAPSPGAWLIRAGQDVCP